MYFVKRSELHPGGELSDCRPWMRSAKSCCHSAIYQQPSVSLWLWLSARTCCGQTARRLQVRHVYHRDRGADWLITKICPFILCLQYWNFDLTVLLFNVCKKCSFLHNFCNSPFLPDPFVKVYLLQDGKKISKKKTSTKRDDTNPIFNEAMIFSVPSNVLQVRPFFK